MLKRFSTLLVSTLWIIPTSTVKTGVCNLEGMTGRLLSSSYNLLEDTIAARRDTIAEIVR
jgi:hypothetical protein